MRHSDLSGTAYLDFENVRVPNFNLVGRENDGFKMVMFNFNHERWMVACACSRFSRVCLEESVKYALRRRTFGKLLHEHQSVRMKVKVKVGGGHRGWDRVGGWVGRRCACLYLQLMKLPTNQLPLRLHLRAPATARSAADRPTKR
jgi:hypothetical protein